jgi:hypothetical protein
MRRKKKQDKLMKEAGEIKERQGSYIDKTRNHHAPLPPPTTPLLPVHATQLCIGLRFGCKTVQNHASLNYMGRRRGRLQRLFNFHLLFYMVEAPSSTSTLVAFFNFNPRRLQLQPSSPTSSLVAFHFNSHRLSISKPRRFSISSPYP